MTDDAGHINNFINWKIIITYVDACLYLNLNLLRQMSTDVDNVKEAEIIVKINQIPIHWYLNCYLNDSINFKLKRIK